VVHAPSPGLGHPPRCIRRINFATLGHPSCRRFWGPDHADGDGRDPVLNSCILISDESS
jgi:hypothetical protein